MLVAQKDRFSLDHRRKRIENQKIGRILGSLFSFECQKAVSGDYFVDIPLNNNILAHQQVDR
jgi:hypothetical protein